MALDRLGKTVATGTAYVLAGVCRRVDGDSVLLVTGDSTTSNDAHRVKAGDLLQVADAAPPAATQAWPVGSIFLSMVDTSPADLLGYGTWVNIGAGRVLIGLDDSDPDFDALAETGGSKTVAAAGSVSAPTLSGTTATEGSHTHSVTSNVAVAAHTMSGSTASEASHTHSTTVDAHGTKSYQVSDTGVEALLVDDTTADHTASTGAGSSHSHGVGTIAPSAHSVTNNAVTSGAGSAHDHKVGTLAASAPTFTGSATSVVQPYLVCHMWQRTA